jgi:hypothetical protein
LRGFEGFGVVGWRFGAQFTRYGRFGAVLSAPGASRYGSFPGFPSANFSIFPHIAHGEMRKSCSGSAELADFRGFSRGQREAGWVSAS